MKPWSPYNTLFQSQKHGWFLYNALSGVMIELDEEHYRIACSLRDGKPRPFSEVDSVFMEQLEQHGILAERITEKTKLMISGYDRNAACFDTSTIGLTICPTLACNFGCPYCFEGSQNDGTSMSDDTIDALVRFIRKHLSAQHLSVSWYGGEPTLNFDVIEKLTARFIELYPDYNNAGMVTNAYLLDQAKIDRLEDLRITALQITLDGSKATHDKRRKLKNGGGTYDRILNNLDLLMNSAWKGRCIVRVNVDKTNQEQYATLHKHLLERYAEKSLSVYAGRVNTFMNHDYNRQCAFTSSEWASFTCDRYRKDGIMPRNGFYPESGTDNRCVATNHYGYIIGPEGSIYKCWEDVGEERFRIGSLHDAEVLSNPGLRARYSIGTDPFTHQECMECRVFPICGGGCARKRLRALHFREKEVDYCSPLKDALIDYLEAYIETWQSRQVCKAVLGKAHGPSMEKGYRMVQPQKKNTEETKKPQDGLNELQ